MAKFSKPIEWIFAIEIDTCASYERTRIYGGRVCNFEYTRYNIFYVFKFRRTDRVASRSKIVARDEKKNARKYYKAVNYGSHCVAKKLWVPILRTISMVILQFGQESCGTIRDL